MHGEGPYTSTDRESVRILVVPKDVEACVLFCGPLDGLLVHKWQGKPTACPGEGLCPLATHRAFTLWYGYAPVVAWRVDRGDWVPRVLQITAGLEEVLHARRLRGEVWLLQRDHANKKTAPLTGCLLESRDEATVPPAFDIRPPLCRMYNVATLALGVPNPVPRKLLVAPAKLPPPPGLGSFGLADAPRPTANNREALRRLAPRGLAAAVEESAERNGHK